MSGSEYDHVLLGQTEEERTLLKGIDILFDGALLTFRQAKQQLKRLYHQDKIGEGSNVSRDANDATDKLKEIAHRRWIAEASSQKVLHRP